jgi:hypothetical protein
VAAADGEAGLPVPHPATSSAAMAPMAIKRAREWMSMVPLLRRNGSGQQVDQCGVI